MNRFAAAKLQAKNDLFDASTILLRGVRGYSAREIHRKVGFSKPRSHSRIVSENLTHRHIEEKWQCRRLDVSNILVMSLEIVAGAALVV